MSTRLLASNLLQTYSYLMSDEEVIEQNLDDEDFEGFNFETRTTEAQRAIEVALIENSAQINLAQIEVNKEEAKHKSLFVSGWRPAVGWTCCIALLSNYILIPMANFGLLLAEMNVEVPSLDMSAMMPVLLGMLGLGAMRTVEKTQKVSREK